MRFIIMCMSAYVTWLCEAWQVTPETIADGRRGNQPPPTGGIASI